MLTAVRRLLESLRPRAYRCPECGAQMVVDDSQKWPDEKVDYRKAKPLVSLVKK